jgi:phage gp36-like protein
MSYTTINDLRKRLSEQKLIQLTDYKQSGSTDTDVVTAALGSASGIIDSYAAGRYTLPLTASAQVKDIELTIAIYKLHEGRQLVPDQVRQSYEDAIAFLKDVSSGKASLDQAATLQVSGMGEVVTRDHDTSPYGFDDTRLADFIG